MRRRIITIYTDLTKKAMKLCFEAHKDQFDKSGIPYVLHPLHVAEQMPDETTTVVALLHDVVEDTDYTLEDIRAAGFPKVVTDALALLTHDESVPYLEYVAALRDNPIAKCVKLADLEHNSNLSRIDHPTAEDYLRVQKYEKAMDILEDQPETDVKAYEKAQLTDEWIQIGSSCREYNAVTMIGMRDGQIVPQMLWFDIPGEYYAPVIHDGKSVPEGYKEIARFEAFVDTISVNGDGTYLEGKEIVFYRKGKDGCIITVKDEET